MVPLARRAIADVRSSQDKNLKCDARDSLPFLNTFCSFSC